MRIKNYNLRKETVLEIGKFAVLWNDFENEFFGNNCNMESIKEKINQICIDKEKQKALSVVLNNRRNRFKASVTDYVDNSLHPGNARISREEYKKYMEDFLNQQGNNTELGCLLSIYRIRNNMMHGLKSISNLDGQIELFKSVNEVLESIKRVCCN